MDITKRQIDILSHIVEEYAETATPVGSITMARLFDVSPATIRAEMARLEKLGLIAQPHASAGRVPTDAGYRFYVNRLVEAGSAVKPTSSSELVGPINFDRSAHAIRVRIFSQSRADQAIRGAADVLAELTADLAVATIGDQMYFSGLTRLFAQPEFSNASQVQAVAELIDNMEPWLREAQPGEPLNIFIGRENPICKNSKVSLVISKFRSPYSDRSYIGVLGPTRQDYLKVMRLVRETGAALEALLIHG